MEDEVAAALTRPDPTKDTGADLISAKVLKTPALAVSSSLCHLFNACLRLSQFPSEWKAIYFSYSHSKDSPHQNSR